LAGLLGLNRTTVSAAYELLEAERLVQGQVGRGSFVSGRPAELAGLPWAELLGSGTAAAAASGLEARISFTTSRPAESLFPLEEFERTFQEVMRSGAAPSILQLGSPGGYAPLRRYLLEEARAEGTARPGDEVVITSGCQQALDLLQRVLVRPGDAVYVEDPVYPGVRTLLERSGASLVGLPLGPEGLLVEAFERAVARQRPRLLIVTPNFQNPTGVTLGLAARRAILRLARQAGVIVVENDIYGGLRYQGEPLPTLKELDETGDVILLRSFSKIAFPGLRVGWVTAPRPVAARLAEAKQWADLHTDQLSQALLLRFAESGRLEAHHQRVLATGKERLHAVLDGCQRHLPREASFTRPEGGMNLWIRLPEPLDAGELLPRAQRENVTYLPGKFFAVTRPETGSLRLSFAGLEPRLIRKGVEILAAIFSAELERVRQARRSDPAPAMV
jgi:2-aminoadipate transaminase